MTKSIRIAMIAAMSAVLMGAGALNPACAASDSATYSYDALGRLIAVTYANGTSIGTPTMPPETARMSP